MKKISIAFLLILSFFFAVVLRADQTVLDYENKISTIDRAPTAPVGLVFGASVKPDGRLSDVLKDRVLTGVELYNAGKVAKLVMTGDNNVCVKLSFRAK